MIEKKNNLYELPDSSSFLIGREKELDFLSTNYKDALNKMGNCTGVIAEAGVGKTLLTNTFLSKLDTSNINILLGRCYIYEKDSLYYMWREFFIDYFNIMPTFDHDKIVKQVTTQFNEEIEDEELNWVPLLLKVMGLEVEESRTTRPILPALKERKFFKIISQMIINRSKKIPLILYFEDIHWIDEKSHLLLKYIITQISSDSVYIIFTSRDNSFVSKINNLKHFNNLQVNNLEKIDAVQLIRSLLKLKEHNIDLESQILKSSQCNPFFIDTIIKSIKDNEILTCDDSGIYHINGNIKDIEIPRSIKNVILSRIDNLEQQEQLVIKTASVIGQNFSYPALSKMLNSDIAETSEVKSSLKILEDQDLMNKEDNLDTNSYVFKHMSIRDVVYQTLLQGAKTRLNLVLASYLESNSSDDLFSLSERLALHYFNGKDYKKALFYSIKSAEKANDLFSSYDAIIHYNKALEICSLLQKETKGCGIQHIFNIKLALIKTYRITGQYDIALATSYECLSIKLSAKDKAKLYIDMANVYHEAGKINKSITICEKALILLGKSLPNTMFEIYKSIGIQLVIHYINSIPLVKNTTYSYENKESQTLQVSILNILTKVYYFDIIEKSAWASILKYNIAAHLGNREILSNCATDFGITMISSGFKEFGLIHLNRGIEMTKSYSNPRTEAICKGREALYYLFHNDPFKSIEIIDDVVNTYKEIGEMWELITALGAQGQNYYNISNYEKSIELYQESYSLAKLLDSEVHKAWKYCHIPFIHFLQNKITYQEAVKGLYNAINISLKARDFMNLSTTYGHLVEIAILENDIEVLPELIELILKTNKNYSADIPHSRISLVYALEGIIKLDNPTHKKTAKKIFVWICKLSRKYESLTGPTQTAKSKYFNYIGKNNNACKASLRSMNQLKDSPYKRDYALSLYQAANCFPEMRDEYNNKAREILHSLGLSKEANL